MRTLFFGFLAFFLCICFLSGCNTTKTEETFISDKEVPQETTSDEQAAAALLTPIPTPTPTLVPTPTPEPVYINGLKELVSSIQHMINNSSITSLASIIDPNLPREWFLTAELFGRTYDAFENLIPVAQLGETVSLAYISSNISDDNGTLTYSVKRSNANSYRETINVFCQNEKWYVSCSGYNSYLESIIYNGGFGPFQCSQEMSLVSVSDLEKFQRGQKVGLCTRDKQEVLQPCFQQILDFVEGYCPVEMNEKWGFINAQGVLVVDYVFDDVYKTPLDGYWWVKTSNGWGAMNFDLEMLVYPQFEEITSVNENTSLLCMKNNGQYGVVSASGLVVIPFKYEDIGRLCAFEKNSELLPVKYAGYWGVVDIHDNTVLDFIYSDIDNNFTNGVIGVAINDACGAIDSTGEYVIRLNRDYYSVSTTPSFIGVECINKGMILFDYSGNPILPEKSFEEEYICLDNGNVIVTEKRKQGFNKQCFLVKTDGSLICLSDLVFESLHMQFQNDYENARDNYWSNYDISFTGIRGITIVEAFLATHFTSGYTVCNLINDEGELLLPVWTTDYICNNNIVNNYIVYSERNPKDKTLHDWYIQNIDDKNKKPQYAGTLTDTIDYYGKFRGAWYKDTQSLYIVDTTDNKRSEVAIVDCDNGIVYSVPEYAGVDYELGYRYDANNEYAIFVTDGVFYGLLDKNGLVGKGVSYTDYNYNLYTGIYTLIRGSNVEEKYRILPDGSSTLIE